jgi:hypothetical protein
MAILDVTEFSSLGQDQNAKHALAGQTPPQALQQVAVGAGSTVSAPFGAATRIVRLHTDVICRVEFGPTPIAAATSFRMAANTTEYFGVIPGQAVAAITST